MSPGTNQYDSRTHRIARSLAARGDTVTVYARWRSGLAPEESLDGYRVVRLRVARGGDGRGVAGRRRADRARTGPGGRRRADVALLRHALGQRVRHARERWRAWQDGNLVLRRFREFPGKYRAWSHGFEAGVEPHDLWHGMWAGSLPVLERVRKRHGGRTIYDPRDVFLRSRFYATMPRWQRYLLTHLERHWAHRADAVIAVSEPYAAMMERDLDLRDVPVIRNCAERWDPPVPRPDLIRDALSLPSSTVIVLYQGGLLVERGVEQAMDAILDVPNAVLVCQGFGDQEERLRARAARAPWRGHVRFVDPVPPGKLRLWAASSDLMVMLIQPANENHAHTTPQKLWEAMAAGVPVVAADLPGMRAVIDETGCGVVCDPTDPAAIAIAIRGLLDLGGDGLRAVGERGLAAAHASYSWERQFEELERVYDRLLRP